MQQGCDGGPLGGGLFIQETPGAVLAHHKLLKQHRNRKVNKWVSEVKRTLKNLTIVSFFFYLQRFIKPAVSTVGERPASVQNLCCFTAGISVNQRRRQQKFTEREQKGKFSFSATSVLSQVSKQIHERVCRSISG